MAERTEAQKAASRANAERAREKKRAAADEAALKAVPVETIEPDPVVGAQTADDGTRYVQLDESVSAEDGEIVKTVNAALDRRRRLLADLPADQAALITDDELAEIEREEMERALAEQKKKALADARTMARQYARIEHDLIPSGVLRSEEERRRLAEKVRIRIDLPEGGGATGFRIDGRYYRQGMEYTVTRAQFESMQSMFYRMHLSEVEFATLDQHKRGNSAREVLSRRPPHLEVLH
jgi:hypothetical protein